MKQRLLDVLAVIVLCAFMAMFFRVLAMAAAVVVFVVVMVWATFRVFGLLDRLGIFG